jgi:hypothetical protein
MAKLFTFNSSTVQCVAPNFNPVKLFGANSTRVSLIVNCSDSSNGARMSVAIDQQIIGRFSFTNNPSSLTFTYRDYGPVIQQEIWIVANNVPGVTATITGMEVYPVPGS